MIAKRMTTWMFMLMFLAGFVQGQVQWTEHYNAAAAYDVIDNNVNCQTHNCFLAAGSSTARVVQISTGYDGLVLGLGNWSSQGGNIYALPLSTTSAKADWSFWSANPGNVYGMAARNASEVYILTWTGGCASYGYAISRYDGSRFNSVNGCLTQMAITADGILLGVNSQGGLFYTTNPRVANPTWVQIPNGTFWDVVGLNSSTAFAIGGNTLYQVNLTNNTYAAMSGAPAVNSIAVAWPYLFAVTTGGVTKRLNFGTKTWVTVAGNMAAVYGSAQDRVFGLASSNQPFHYLNSAVRGTVSSSGYTDCGTNGCPQGSVHTITSRAGFPSGYFSTNSASNSGSPSATIAASTYDVAGACDLEFGDLNSGNCALTVGEGEVQCTVMGEIFYQTVTGSPLKFRSETAFTHVKVTSGAPYWNANYQLWFYSNITPECVNTSNPDFNPKTPPGFQVSDVDGHDAAMDIESFGLSINGGPWYWFNVNTDGATEAIPGYESDPGPSYCTVY